MKALTLYPEHAELFRLGIRTVETRSWSTTYRGPLALHAGMRDPDSAAARRWPLTRPALDAIPHGDPIPRGAVVVTCTLVDVVPIVEGQFTEHDHEKFVLRCVGGLGREVLNLAERAPDPGPGIHHYSFGCGAALTDMTDQLHLGDFTDGRFAFLFDDIEPLAEPVPARGRQGLWEWEDPR